jgi:hypothetical protein
MKGYFRIDFRAESAGIYSESSERKTIVEIPSYLLNKMPVTHEETSPTVKSLLSSDSVYNVNPSEI